METRTYNSRMQEKLEAQCPGIPVYFRPPIGFTKACPCIVFDYRNVRNVEADNSIYLSFPRFLVTLETRDAEDPNFAKLLSMEASRFFDARQKSGLNMYTFSVTLF